MMLAMIAMDHVLRPAQSVTHPSSAIPYSDLIRASMASMEGPSVTTFTYTICANTAAVTVAGRATDNSQFMQPAARALKKRV
jgi:hypothetical protein